MNIGFIGFIGLGISSINATDVEATILAWQTKFIRLKKGQIPDKPQQKFVVLP